jgi:hypothetical protein
MELVSLLRIGLPVEDPTFSHNLPEPSMNHAAEPWPARALDGDAIIALVFYLA